jgi:Uma2 family endonuclease
MPLLKEKPYYTYADFLEWDEGERYEIMDGEAVMLAAPDLSHQVVSGAIYQQLAAFLKGKPCQVLYAPLAVRLSPRADDSDDTVLEPDIIVVCDPGKLEKRGCKGAPDFIIEILSPSTAKYDKLVKFNKYLEAGVREYWMADPDTLAVQVCVLENGRYWVSTYGETDTVPVSVLPGCLVDLRLVFGEQAN